MAKGWGELRACVWALLVLAAKIFILRLPVPAVGQHSSWHNRLWGHVTQNNHVERKP